MTNQQSSRQIDEALSERVSPQLSLDSDAVDRVERRLLQAFDETAGVEVRLDTHNPGGRRRWLLIAAAVGFFVVGVGGLLLVNQRNAPGRHTTPLDEPAISELITQHRTDLDDRAVVELFRVNADSPSYWHVASLVAFDGHSFTVGYVVDAGSEANSSTTLASFEQTSIRQQVQILDLGGNSVPAASGAFRAEGFRAGDRLDLRLNRETGGLVVMEVLRPGDLFTIESSQPVFTPDLVGSATSSSPPTADALELAAQLAAELNEFATTETELTAARSTFDVALALQNRLRNWSLDESGQGGHSVGKIQEFLVRESGTAEQFATAFALIARSLDIPSRVVVGYTSGTVNDNGWYEVTGSDAHMWPELWFDGIGWVPFEPTPGRHNPALDEISSGSP